MLMTWPVMYAALSLTRKNTRSATSRGCPRRRIGMSGSTWSSGTSLIISVSISPGATAFTVISRFASSCASERVAPMMPALAAE